MDKSNIVEFASIRQQENEPHIVIPTDDGNAHVIPRSVFDAIGQGEMDITDIEDYRPIARKIAREWLVMMEFKARINGEL